MCRPVVIVLFLLSLLLAGCDTAPRTSDKDLNHLAYRDVKEMLADSTEKRPVVLVDLRNADQFAKGHIPGALNIPYSELRAGDERLEKAHKIIIYAESYRGQYPDVAAKKLMSLGYKESYSFAGGWNEWLKGEGLTPADPAKDAPKETKDSGK